MKKVDLDKEFEKWKSREIENLRDRFLEIHCFNDFIEEAWQEYQQEEGLIDKNNEFTGSSFDEIKERKLED